MSTASADTIELDSLEELVPGPSLPTVRVSGTGSFSSAFDVDRAAFVAAAAANAAFGAPRLERAGVLAMFAGKAEVDHQPVPAWNELSGYYRTADGGYMQLHCNFAHHAHGVVDELGCASTRESVQKSVLRRNSDELEASLISRGMIAAKLRTLDEWHAHPHAIATAALPLVTVEQIGDAPPRRPDRRLRVLDCSRVLAGPVAGQMFAAHGADTLRIGSAHLPSVEIGVLTTGSGKRNAFVELATEDGRATMRNLLGSTDVWIDAYRPGAFSAQGFGLDSAAPGSVVVQLSGFDWVGPWGGRRGFDSIVQSTTGIVLAGAAAAEVDAPTPLPVQALDYCTGLLAAFAGRRLVEHQAAVGGTWLARLSLLRTRNWLVAMGGPKPFRPEAPAVSPEMLHTTGTPFGMVTTAKPISGEWDHGPLPLGSSTPTWLDQ